MKRVDIRGMEFCSEPDCVALERACATGAPTETDAETAAVALHWHPRRAAIAIAKGIESGLFRVIH